MTIGKLIGIAVDIGAVIALLWFLYERAIGVPMEAPDWVLVGFMAGVFVAVFTVHAKGEVRR